MKCKLPLSTFINQVNQTYQVALIADRLFPETHSKTDNAFQLIIAGLIRYQLSNNHAPKHCAFR